jgi:hypothetical protein
MANNAANSTAANNGGIEVGPVGSAYATLLYNTSANVWVSSLGISAVGNVSGASLIGTIATASQTSITSVGTLGSLAVTANITGGNLLTAGLISSTGAITGAALTGTNLTVSTGNITGGNLLLSGAITDSGQLDIQTSAANSNIVLTPNGTGNVNTGANVSVTGNVQAGNVRTAGLISATGNINGGNLSVGTGTITAGNIVNSNGNAVGNIGSSSNYFNRVFAQSTSALYADLAELYLADAEYAPGTVVSFGGELEVTGSTVASDAKVAGIVSTNPSYLMNSGLIGENVVAVALQGRVPCSVTGTVRKGDMLVSNGNGTARAEANPAVGTVIGKALADFTGENGIIEVVVGIR